MLIQLPQGCPKLASKNLGVINRARQYFMPAHILALYKAQVRAHMEYCSHFWSGAPQYQLESFVRVQRGAAQIVGDLALLFYGIYHGECSEELFHLCSFQKTFIHILQSYGMSFRRVCGAGIAPVIPLVLQEKGGGDYVTSGDLYAHLSSFSIKKLFLFIV
ncbi:unnamed protein product [Leptidea sinapis]|uniref:Uncharacterized protein n=1 Tax=Leptidea sinapis TaxID=189913 RepID=A0A5E4QYF3_9NEOP|nr:unnamed protein product [Leptidea sinapis]